MPYDAVLAERIRDVVEDQPGLTARPMFGGLAFMIDGHLAVSASSEGDILLRVDPERTEQLIAAEHVTRYTMRGRELDGWLHVGREAVLTQEELREWVALGVDYARSLPARR